MEVPRGYIQMIQPFLMAGSAKNWSVTYGLKYNSSSPLQTQVSAYDTLFRTAWRPLADNTMQFLPAVAYFQPTDGGPLQLTNSTVAAQAGQLARNSPPPQVAVCIRKRTAFVGKKYRGRIFMPGLIDETNVDEAGIITPAGVTSLQTQANVWLNGAETGIDDDGLWLFHANVLDTPTRITSLVVQPIVRTQRRRLPRG